MTLLCRPVGKGNWNLIVVTIEGHADLFTFQKEHRFTWGDPPRTLRVVEVRP